MVSFHQVFVASALLALSNAIPLQEKRAQPFVVDMVPKTNPTIKNGAAAYLKALVKYNASAELISQVSIAATSGSVTATPAEYDEEYTCPVTIGSQTFQLDFDTGSSDLWVLGSQVARSGGSGHTYYTPGSTASREAGESWSIEYADGSSASGVVYSDTVTIGGTSVTGQGVEEATSASSTFYSGPEDGLVGLGFDNINTAYPRAVSTFITNAINQGLPAHLFTALLRHNAPGRYTFGTIDSTQHTGTIAYTPVDTSEGYWMFTPTAYAIGSGSTVTAGARVLRGIADTGTTLLMVDTSIANAYWARVSGSQYTQGVWIFPCSGASSLPSFTVVIAGYRAVVPGSYMNYSPNGDGTCYGGIQPSEGLGFNIYGDIFLKSQFVVFDRSQSTPRLGFAPQA